MSFTIGIKEIINMRAEILDLGFLNPGFKIIHTWLILGIRIVKNKTIQCHYRDRELMYVYILKNTIKIFTIIYR